MDLHLFDVREEFCTDILPDDTIRKIYRPKSLRGIENNNGWIKIESEEDLPKHQGDYFVYTHNKVIETIYADGDISLMKHTSKSWIRNFTHYQAIEKPKPPVY